MKKFVKISDQEENENDFEAGEEENVEDIMDQVIGVPLTKGFYYRWDRTFVC